jgi:hypothetical protein
MDAPEWAELFTRPSIELITVEAKAIRDAESQIAACERCRPEESEIPFDWILWDVLGKHAMCEFILTERSVLWRIFRCQDFVSSHDLVLSSSEEVDRLSSFRLEFLHSFYLCAAIETVNIIHHFYELPNPAGSTRSIVRQNDGLEF